MPDNSLWYKDAVFYELYVRAYRDSNGNGHGDLGGVIEKLDYLQTLGVNCIWLLPTYPSPLKDDGYDIADYYNIHPDYGTLDDFKALVDAVHKRGMRIITDLVLNHTSDRHPWFQAARKNPESPYRDYYVWNDTDEKYQQARIIFLDVEESNWTWDEKAGQYYWHRFYKSQPDLNFDNPKVQEEMLSIAKFWLDLGVDGFRVDAVPYLFEREGTNCENLPETHAYMKKLRAFMEQHYPDRILLSEANGWPEDIQTYFGNGDEFHMAFHFPLMLHMYIALHKQSKSPLENIIARTPALSNNTQWCTFLRNHDELTLEMATEEDRQWMWQEYAPEPRMRQNLGIRRRLAPLLNNNRQKIELAFSLLFTLPGSPTLYYGDEIGMGDNIWLPDRNGVRTPMQWEDAPNGGFSKSNSPYAPVLDSEKYAPSRVNVTAQSDDPESLFNTIRQMIAVRSQHKAFSWGDFTWVEERNPAVAVFWRQNEAERLLILNNLSSNRESIKIKLPEENNKPQLLLGKLDYKSNKQKMVIEIEGYGYCWMKF
ncbi:MAG: maltose alpha-D-glucosyltransferase [Chloroflexi bacterium]|nr:maltose alpha-D-glucosyltransferase [Chloroflexota bacterium]